MTSNVPGELVNGTSQGGAAPLSEADAEFWRLARWAAEKNEPRCKHGFKLNGCELGYPGCACADEMLNDPNFSMP